MNDRERLRLAWALLDEAVAIAEGEAGSDNDLVRRWALRVAHARLEYREACERELQVKAGLASKVPS